MLRTENLQTAMHTKTEKPTFVGTSTAKPNPPPPLQEMRRIGFPLAIFIFHDFMFFSFYYIIQVSRQLYMYRFIFISFEFSSQIPPPR